MDLSAPSSPQRVSGPTLPRTQAFACPQVPIPSPDLQGRGRHGVVALLLHDPCCSMSSDRVTKTSHRRPPRWLTRSPTRPWTSTLPRGPRISSSLASDRRGPRALPSHASVPQYLVLPLQREPHFLQNAAPLGNLRQSKAPSFALRFRVAN